MLIVGILLLVIGPLYWLSRIVRFFRNGQTRKGSINLTLLCLLALTICWELRLIPLSSDWDFRNKTLELTGKQFWSWNDYRYDEMGLRGEGFTFEIYSLNEQMVDYFAKPSKNFFTQYPEESLQTSKWSQTPITDTDLINYVTPIYGNWSKSLQAEIRQKQELVRQIAMEAGSYYAIKRSNGTDLYLISPKHKVIIYINHNM